MDIKSQYKIYQQLNKTGTIEEVNQMRTEIIRNCYLNNRLAAVNPIFQKLITEERSALMDSIYRLTPNEVTDTTRTSPFSGINTLLAIKLEREAEIPMTETTNFIYQEEAIFLRRSIWQKNCEKFIVEKYQNPDLFHHAGLFTAIRDIENKIPLLAGLFNNTIEEEQHSSKQELQMDIFLDQFNQDNLSIPQQELIENALLVFFCINYLYGNIFEMKYYLMKLIEHINPENNLYWTYKFFENELIVHQTIQE